MKIAILTYGSRGDVQPFLALALGLQEIGHTVHLGAPPDFQAFVSECGAEFFPVGEYMRDFMQEERVKAFLASNGIIERLRFQLHWVRRMFDHINSDAWKACQGVEAIIFPKEGFIMGHSFAQKLDVPCLRVGVYTLPPRRTFSLAYALEEQLYWQSLRRTTNAFRQNQLGLGPFPFFGPARQERAQGLPILYAYSPVLFPKIDTPDYVHITGYWFLDSFQSWQPPQALMDFIRSGPAPVYVGFGSMLTDDPQRVLKLVLEALALSGQRGVLVGGWGGLQVNAPLPESVFYLEGASFSWLFPRMAAVVHHGGVGTTGLGLASGVPSILVPFIADQFWWGQVVAGLGVGPKAIPYKALTAERLAQAIRIATSNESMRKRAAAVGERIRSENGVARAVEIIERYFSTCKYVEPRVRL